MKFKPVFLVFLTCIAACVFAIPLENLVVPSNLDRLNSSGGLITETQLRNPVPRLLPGNSGLQQAIAEVIETLNPGLMVESLHLYKKPEHSHTNPNNWNETQKSGLLNQLLALSTLTGIQYYSASRGTMRTFFEYSSVIDAPNTKNPLPDPVYSMLPAELILYARQKDLTFGDNIYLYNYTISGDIIYFIQENVTSLSVSLIPAIGRRNLKTVMAVFDCGDSLLIYAVSMARAVSVPGMGDRIGISFNNRAEAIIKWFTARADLIFYSQ